MSRRVQPTIEEDFDDDTDLLLPSRPLPNTGLRGALLQEVSDDEDDEEDEDEDDIGGAAQLMRPTAGAGPASPSQGGGFGLSQQGAQNTISDLTPYKKWTCIYPVYIDAKRAYGTGLRRISRAKSVWWPLSKDIAEAASRLGLGTLHEVHKCHPRDWDNPGRVRVQLRREGRLVNERIKSKKKLLEAISFYIQNIKPELIPREPYVYTSPTSPSSAKTPSSGKQKQISAKTSGKGKEKGKAPAAAASTVVSATAESTGGPRGRLPQSPEPYPALAGRLSAFSPTLPSGVLVDAIKASMSAAAAENAALPPGMGGKGKRKVVRVRG